LEVFEQIFEITKFLTRKSIGRWWGNDSSRWWGNGFDSACIILSTRRRTIAYILFLIRRTRIHSRHSRTRGWWGSRRSIVQSII